MPIHTAASECKLDPSDDSVRLRCIPVAHQPGQTRRDRRRCLSRKMFLNGGGKIRTSDLRVMGATSLFSTYLALRDALALQVVSSILQLHTAGTNGFAEPPQVRSESLQGNEIPGSIRSWPEAKPDAGRS
jgi:hypothetical protein